MIKKCTSCSFKTEEPKKYFCKNLNAKDGFNYQCKECKQKTKDIYASTEYGFMMIMFDSLNRKIKSKRYKNLSEKEKNKYQCYITRKKFFELWEKHKKKFGYYCQLTGIQMICKRSKGKKGAGFLGYHNAVSVDRLNPDIGYNEENIIFVTNKANKDKGAVTKEMCKKILEIYNERNL